MAFARLCWVHSFAYILSAITEFWNCRNMWAPRVHAGRMLAAHQFQGVPRHARNRLRVALCHGDLTAAAFSGHPCHDHGVDDVGVRHDRVRVHLHEPSVRRAGAVWADVNSLTPPSCDSDCMHVGSVLFLIPGNMKKHDSHPTRGPTPASRVVSVPMCGSDRRQRGGLLAHVCRGAGDKRSCHGFGRSCV